MAVGVVSSCPQAPINSRPQDKLHQFEDVVLALKEALGPSSGLDSKDVDVNFLMDIMRVYDAEEEGWVPYAMADPSRGYTRNLVDEGNGKSNLVSYPANRRPSLPSYGVEL
jgi:cysteine dioxygenase